MPPKQPQSARRLSLIAFGAFALVLLALALHRFGTHVQVSAEPATSGPTPAPNAVGRVVRVETARADAALHGKVVDVDGAPLAGATVCAACAGCNLIQADAAPSCVRSQTGGRYELQGLAAGDYLVSAAAEGYLPTRAERGGVISIEARTELDIQLQAGGARVTGVVMDITGGPVAGALVQASSGTEVVSPSRIVQATTTDLEGRFSFSCPPGHVALRATADGYASGFASGTAPTRGISVIVTPASSIRGVVVTEQGQPVEGLKVTAQTETGDVLTAPSGEAGRFELAGLSAGTYQLKASGPGWLGVHPATIALSIADSAEDVLLTVKKAASLRGTLLAKDKTPCAHGQVHLGPGPRSFAVPQLHAVSDAQGAVVFDAVPAGSYQSTIQCEIGDLQAAQSLEVDDRDEEEIVWQVKPQLEVSGRVVDERGQPVARLMLELRMGVQGMFVEASAADGSFVFRGIAPASYVLRAPDVVEDLPLEVRDRSITDLTVVAKAVGSIAVRATTPDGAPLAGLLISAKSDGREFDNPEQLGDGVYRFDSLPAGSYTISVSDGVNPRTDAGSGPTIVRSGETAQVDVRYGGHEGRIAGRVVDDSGSPLENVWVQARPANDGDSLLGLHQLKVLAENRRSLTDREGRFELTGLSERGSFEVQAQWPLGGEARIAGVTPGATIELVLEALGSIAGTAVDVAGNPVEHLVLQLVNQKTGQQRSAFVRAYGGAWRLEDVTPGPLQILANDVKGNVAMLRQTLAPRQQLSNLRLQLGPPELAQRSVPEPGHDPDVPSPPSHQH